MPTDFSSRKNQIPTDRLLDSRCCSSCREPGASRSPRMLKGHPVKTPVKSSSMAQGCRASIVSRDVSRSSPARCCSFRSARKPQLEPGSVLTTVAGGPSGATQIWPKPAGILYAAGDYIANARIALLHDLIAFSDSHAESAHREVHRRDNKQGCAPLRSIRASTWASRGS